MTEDLKKRLIGAAVLVSLAVIFIPMLLEENTVIDSSIHSTNIPEIQSNILKKPALSEKDIEQRKKDFEFGTTITPAADTEVKTVEISKPDSGEAEVKNGSLATRVGLTSWMIQVGSFSSQDNAGKVVEQLRQAGYDTHLETAQVQSKTVYRVRVGPEIDRKRADEAAQKIAKKFFLTPKVIRYP